MFHIESRNLFPDRFCVVGTDTGVGKTVISALLTKLLNGSYWKPIQSGVTPQTDRQFVQEVINLPPDRILKEAYLLERPLAPALSAELEGKKISLKDLTLPRVPKEPLVIEGVGGILTPLNEKECLADLIKQWNVPVVVVARSTLGTINHTLLTLRALRDWHIPIIGVILNGPKNEGNARAIEKWGSVRVIGEMPFVDDLAAYCREYEGAHAHR